MPTREAERIPDWIKIAFTSFAALESIHIELRLRRIKKLIEEEEEEGIARDGEPVPPEDPNTATPEQIASYKEQVLRATSTTPLHAE